MKNIVGLCQKHRGNMKRWRGLHALGSTQLLLTKLKSDVA